MGDRAYLRPYSPPRRAGGHPGRNSASFLDSHSAGYDPYHGYPRSSRDSIPVRVADGPRRYAPRESLPLRRNPDDYEVPPRRAETARRPAPLPSAEKYRPIIKSATDRLADFASRYKPREDESYYLMPSSSSRSHHRAASTGGPRDVSYPVRAREVPRERGDREYDRGSRQYYNAPAIRQPRDKDDREFGFEYTDHKEQARRDLLPIPRQRARRESDAGPRGRPTSIAGVEDMAKRSGRIEGPPVSTRGFSKIDGSGNTRHEYRYPRESDDGRVGKDDIDLVSRRRSTRDGKRESVSLHQDRADGYSSTAEESYKTNRSRQTDDDRRTTDSYASRYEDIVDVKGKRHHESRLSTQDDSRGYLRPRDDDFVRAESARRDRDKGMDREYVRRRDRGGEDPERDYRRQERGEDRADREHRHRRKPDGDLERVSDEPRDDRPRRKRDDEYERSSNEPRDDRSKPRSLHIGEGAAAASAAAASAAGLYAKRRYERQDNDSPTSKTRGFKDDSRPSQKGSKDDLDGKDESDPDTEEERRERRRLRRREREDRERQEAAARKDASEEQPREVVQDFPNAIQEPPQPDGKDRRGRRHSKMPSETDSEAGKDDSEARHIRLVSPSREPEAKPKGILKSPRVKFPEDPAPVREGVAPLKDAGKKGIPPNARWTKIDRRLVNPEALEFGNERYEERAEYVIVLRVLSKEEIEAYAAKTAEIREIRHREATRRDQVLAIDDKAHQYDEDEVPQLTLADRPYNEPDTVIPGITRDRQSSIPGIVIGDGKASAPAIPAMVPASNEAPNPQPQANTAPIRPEAYPTSSYHRVPPTSNSSVPPSIYGGPAYPVPPPLQSSPMPQSVSPSGPPPPSGPYAQQPPPHNVYVPPVATASQPNLPGAVPMSTYPPPPGAYLQQRFPPPPPPLGTEGARQSPPALNTNTNLPGQASTNGTSPP